MVEAVNRVTSELVFELGLRPVDPPRSGPQTAQTVGYPIVIGTPPAYRGFGSRPLLLVADLFRLPPQITVFGHASLAFPQR